MGKSIDHLVTIVKGLIKKEIDIISLQDFLNISSAQGDLIFNMFASLIEFEKALI
jgi:DNA invertase Pin-like site-specific DNA recombinase